MIPLISVVSTFFGKHKSVIMLTLIALLVFTQWNSCNRNARLKKQLAVAQHNINVLNDIIRYEKTKDGDTLALKLAFLTNKLSKLEDLSSDLYAEVKRIKGNVSMVIKGDVKVVHDTVPMVVKGTLYNNIAHATFDYSKEFSPGNYRKLAGYTRYNVVTGLSSGELTQDEMGMRFTTGIRNVDKGKPEIFLQSDYPGFKVTELNGAFIDPGLFNKKKVPLITAGVGIGWIPVTYDFSTKETEVSLKRIGVSAGVNINVLKLLKPNR